MFLSLTRELAPVLHHNSYQTTTRCLLSHHTKQTTLLPTLNRKEKAVRWEAQFPISLTPSHH